MAQGCEPCVVVSGAASCCLFHFMTCHSKKRHRPRTSSCHKEQQGGPKDLALNPPCNRPLCCPADLAKALGPLGVSSAKAKVRVPRLNGAKMGVLATRSPHRPVPIGLSVGQVGFNLILIKIQCKVHME